MTNSLRNASAYIFVDTSRYTKMRSLPMNHRIKAIQQLFEHTQRSELNNDAKDNNNNNPDSYLNTQRSELTNEAKDDNNPDSQLHRPVVLHLILRSLKLSLESSIPPVKWLIITFITPTYATLTSFIGGLF